MSRLEVEGRGAVLGPLLRMVRRVWVSLEWELRSAAALKSSFLLAAIQPALSVVVFAVVGVYVDRLGGPGLAERFGYGGDYLTFVMTGLIFMTLFRESQNAAARAIRSVRSRMEFIISSRMTIPSFIAATTISHHVKALRDVPVMVLVALLFGARFSGNIDPLVFLASLSVTVAVLSSISVLLGSMSMAVTRAGGVLEEIPSFFYWLNTGIVPLFSGVIFPVQVLPRSLRTISYLLPHTYGLRLVRSSTIGITSYSPAGDLLTLGLFLIVLGPLSLAVLRISLRRAKRIGSMASW